MVFRSKKPYSNKTTRKRKPKSKSTKPKKQIFYSKKNKLQKGGEGGTEYIVTIAIITHGCITTTDTDSLPKYNIRLYNATGDNMQSCDGNLLTRSIHHEELNKFFRKDHPIPDPTNATVKSIPHYFDTMPYDKILGHENPKLVDYIIEKGLSIFTKDPPVGIWLISVHDMNHKLIFPQDPYKKEDPFNLLNINLLNTLNLEFNRELFFSDHNHITETLIKNDKIIPTKSRIFDGWNVNLNDKNNPTHITFIRLSYFLDLLKYIFGNNVNLNVYDYSCTITCNTVKEQIISPLITDIEMGSPPFINTTIGGTKHKKKNKKKKKKTI